MKKRNICIFILILSAIFSSYLVSADSYELRCLREGQSLNFRQLCNPSMSIVRGPTNICVHRLDNGKTCPAPLNACNNQGLSCSGITAPGEPGGAQNTTNQTLPANTPEITLIGPQNALFLQQPAQISFIFKVSKSYTISSCRLQVDDSTVASTSSITSSQMTIRYFVNQGQHLWKVSCTTRPGAFPNVFEVASPTRTLTVGQQNSPPLPTNQNNSTNSTNQTSQNNFNINLITPENNLALTGSQDVLFRFSFSPSTARNSLTSCSLFLNNAPDTYSINSFYTAGTSSLPETFEISKTLSPDSYSWKIECSSSAKTSVSETRALTINEQQSTTTTNSSGNTVSQNNERTQTARKTTSEKTQSKAENKFEQLTDEKSEELSGETEQENAKITGAVIENALKNKTVVTATSVILFLVLITLLFYSRKTGKKKR